MSVFVCKRHFWWRHVWRHLFVTMLPCWAKFSNALVHCSVRMIYAKNYKTVTKFVKVMPRIILWPLFSWTRCIFWTSLQTYYRLMLRTVIRWRLTSIFLVVSRRKVFVLFVTIPTPLPWIWADNKKLSYRREAARQSGLHSKLCWRAVMTGVAKRQQCQFLCTLYWHEWVVKSKKLTMWVEDVHISFRLESLRNAEYQWNTV